LNVAIQNIDDKKPDFNTIRFGIPCRGEIFVRRIPMSDVPKDDAECSKFLHKLYKEKDDIFDVFHRTGSFASLGAKKIDIPKTFTDCYFVAFWILTLFCPFLYWIYTIIAGPSLLSKSIIFIIYFLCKTKFYVFKLEN
jgi:lysophosphatidic acid acyltransferase/lysophosphatidylinositol acyltransferase